MDDLHFNDVRNITKIVDDFFSNHELKTSGRRF